MRGGGILGVVLAAGLGTACFVEVHKVADPRAAFEKAKAEAQRYQGQPGPGHELNVLVYDGHDGELVQVSLPLWLVRKIDREGGDLELDGPEGRVKDHLRRHLRLRDIEKAGLGILVEVEEEESGDQVLVWLR
jgi:hypothetical protein